MKEIDLQLWWNKIKKHDFFLSTMAIILSIIFFVLALIQLDYIARVASHDGTMDQKFIWTCFVIMVITAFPIWFCGTIKKSYVKKFALQSFDQYLAEKLIAESVSIKAVEPTPGITVFLPSEGCYEIICKYGDEIKAYDMTVDTKTKTAKLHEKADGKEPDSVEKIDVSLPNNNECLKNNAALQSKECINELNLSNWWNKVGVYNAVLFMVILSGIIACFSFAYLAFSALMEASRQGGGENLTSSAKYIALMILCLTFICFVMSKFFPQKIGVESLDQYLTHELSADNVIIGGLDSGFGICLPEEGQYEISCKYGDETKNYTMIIDAETKTAKLCQ